MSPLANSLAFLSLPLAMWGSCNIRRDVYIFGGEIIGTGPNFWYTRAFTGQCLAPPQYSRAFTVNPTDSNLNCLKEMVMAESTLHKGEGGPNYPRGVLLHIWDLDCGRIHWSREMGYEDGDVPSLTKPHLQHSLFHWLHRPPCWSAELSGTFPFQGTYIRRSLACSWFYSLLNSGPCPNVTSSLRPSNDLLN